MAAEASPELPRDVLDHLFRLIARDVNGSPSLWLDSERIEEHSDDEESSAPLTKSERHERRREAWRRQDKRERGTILAASQVCRSWREAACRLTWLACLYASRGQEDEEEEEEEELQQALARLQDCTRTRPTLLRLHWGQPISSRLQPLFVQAVAQLRELHLEAKHPSFDAFFVSWPALTSLTLEVGRRVHRCDPTFDKAEARRDPCAFFQREHELYRAAGLESCFRAMPCLRRLSIAGITTPLVERRVFWPACSSALTKLSLELAVWDASALRLPCLQDLSLEGALGGRGECASFQHSGLPARITALSLRRVVLEERPRFACVKSLCLVDCRFRGRFKVGPVVGGDGDACSDDSEPGMYDIARRSEAPSRRGVCDLSCCTALTSLTSRDGVRGRQPHLRYLCGLPPLRALHLDACFLRVNCGELFSAMTSLVELDLHICDSQPTHGRGCAWHRGRDAFPLQCARLLAGLPCLLRLHVLYYEDYPGYCDLSDCGLPVSEAESEEEGSGLGEYFRARRQEWLSSNQYKAAFEQAEQAVVGRGGTCLLQVGALVERGYTGYTGSGSSSWDSEGGEPKPVEPSTERWDPWEGPEWYECRPEWCMTGTPRLYPGLYGLYQQVTLSN